MTIYVFPVLQTYFIFLIYANKFWNYTHVYLNKILMPMKCSVKTMNIYPGKPYLFLHIYDLLNIPHLAVIIVYTAMKFLLQFINM